MAKKNDGTVWNWGQNAYYQLGDGSPGDKIVPTQIGSATDWQSIGAADFHNFLIKTNGTLWGWGLNNNDRVGDGTTTNRATPVQIGTDTDWVKATGGDSHSIAIKITTQLFGWGANGGGQIGDGTTTNRLAPVSINCPTLSINPTSIDFEIQLYPNPTSDIVKVKSFQKITASKIYDITGNVIQDCTYTDTCNEINMSNLSKGLYLIQLSTSSNANTTFKVLKN